MGIRARGRIDTAAGPVVWAFTDRTGGASPGPYAGANLAVHTGDDPDVVAVNRAALVDALGAQGLQAMEQVHGRDVAVIAAGQMLDPALDPAPVADALVTDAVGIALLTQVADCVPLLLADVATGRVAAVHSGWRGVVAGVVDAAVDAMAVADPATMRAWIGPAICPGCYEVGEEVRDRVSSIAPAAHAVTRRGTAAVDVRAGVAEQLAARGVPAAAIELIPGCTAEDPSLYSYRRDGVTGRQAGAIVRLPGGAP